MKELLDTEEKYIRDLEHICTVSQQLAAYNVAYLTSYLHQHYMPSMDDVSELPKVLVGKKHVLFGYLTGILEFNRE